jgi:8-oxo-dGTP pyrophosphatase MutT (NUDIX family)
MIKSWITIDDKKIDNCKFFDIHRVKRKSRDTGREGTFVYLDSTSWVNIIPITKEGNIVLIKQYRHGTDDITIEIPGGLVEANELPRLAGERECNEETGYFSKKNAKFLGKTLPNPAFLNNICYSYVWYDVELKYNQQLDRHEEIVVFERTFDEVKEMINNGKINHSLVLNAFFYYFLKNGF